MMIGKILFYGWVAVASGYCIWFLTKVIEAGSRQIQRENAEMKAAALRERNRYGGDIEWLERNVAAPRVPAHSADEMEMERWASRRPYTGVGK